ncbi:MAG: RNA degradosome polyphosphate kinase, partial [Planctomycetota bacterium]
MKNPKTTKKKRTRKRAKPPAPAAPVDGVLRDPDNYINRELSLLAFNRRVLEQAQDATVPLLERLRFLTICTTNLDEFFEIRVSGLKQQISYGTSQRTFDGRTALETFGAVSQAVHELVEEQYRTWREDLVPALTEEKIRVLRRRDWGPTISRWVKRYFVHEVQPVITPIGLDPSHPFPQVLNKGLSYIVRLSGDDAYDRQSGIAVLQVPRSLPRVIQLPTKGDGHDFTLLGSIIHAHVGELFPGM